MGDAPAAANLQSPISNRSIAQSPNPLISPLPTFFFAGLAVLSLLFAFGTPLYALLYYGLPGWSQLHSPFRWVFPFTLSMAALGALGLNVVLGWSEGRHRDRETGRGGDNLTPHSSSVIRHPSLVTGEGETEKSPILSLIHI